MLATRLARVMEKVHCLGGKMDSCVFSILQDMSLASPSPSEKLIEKLH